jgi:hypothetical protein
VSDGLLWDSAPTQVSFSRGGSRYIAVRLTLRARPDVKLVVYEVGDGVHVARERLERNTVVPRGQRPNDTNLAFVEACVNPGILAKLAADPGLTWDRAKKQAAALVRRGQESPEAREVLEYHLGQHTGLLARSRRLEQVEAMKSIVKRLGDMTEEEMLEVWREARAEEVMES